MLLAARRSGGGGAVAKRDHPRAAAAGGRPARERSSSWGADVEAKRLHAVDAVVDGTAATRRSNMAESLASDTWAILL